MPDATPMPGIPGERPKAAPKRRRGVPARVLSSLGDLDQRTRSARTAKALRDQITADLGGDLTATQDTLATRLALVVALCEHCETRWLNGEGLDDAYLPACGLASRLAQALGLRRVPKTVQPTPLPMWEHVPAATVAAPVGEPAPTKAKNWFCPGMENWRTCNRWSCPCGDDARAREARGEPPRESNIPARAN